MKHREYKVLFKKKSQTNTADSGVVIGTAGLAGRSKKQRMLLIGAGVLLVVIAAVIYVVTTNKTATSPTAAPEQAPKTPPIPAGVGQ